MAVLINGEIGESLGYQWGVKTPKSEKVFEFPSFKEAKKIADSIKGAELVMREAYATLWFETTL